MEGVSDVNEAVFPGLRESSIMSPGNRVCEYDPTPSRPDAGEAFGLERLEVLRGQAGLFCDSR